MKVDGAGEVGYQSSDNLSLDASEKHWYLQFSTAEQKALYYTLPVVGQRDQYEFLKHITVHAFEHLPIGVIEGDVSEVEYAWVASWMTADDRRSFKNLPPTEQRARCNFFKESSVLQYNALPKKQVSLISYSQFVEIGSWRLFLSLFFCVIIILASAYV